MKILDKSILKNGQALLVCDGDAGFFAKEIQKFQALEYPWEIARFHHAGMIKVKNGQYFVEEEGRLFQSIIQTPLDDYLANDNSTFMIREPLQGLSIQDQVMLFKLMESDNGKGVYNVLGVVNFAYKFVAYEITKKQEWLNIGNDKHMEVCSQQVEQWYKDGMGMFKNDNYTMSPADFAASKLFKTIITI
jgi:hypothetical protein